MGHPQRWHPGSVGACVDVENAGSPDQGEQPSEGFDAPGFFRLSYATSMERLREGVDRMFAFVAALEKSGKIPSTTNK